LTTSEAELEGVDQERKSVVVVAGVEMAVAAWEVERLMRCRWRHTWLDEDKLRDDMRN
jgi:hypothetical protein